MEVFGVFKVSASGLEAQRERMNTIASNLANIHTTQTKEGGPYKRHDVVFQTALLDPDIRNHTEGVRVAQIYEDPNPPMMVYDPSHPDANQDGYVAMPNINVVEEMVNMMMATRAYEANVAAFNTSKSMFLKTLDIGK
ncbi:MAG: flagellar basal body rod protein FlgC [Nitrospirae bacterium]|nr:flagellar basal body rod protein FlgC [Nitrospirota bacterium]MBF0518353.1 flagellar basal body rod protein FlgC [Nitrospirota bacterium]MBF0534920.1 flagellar basal body rod protein FlgC [Nitrospirota bacterium]MBF0617229.1 flagellar basal body rod protein FlgC [Nitrospirota bacterium]